MSALEKLAQEGVYGLLDGHTRANLFDHVPALPEGMPATSFPYIIVGESSSSPWDTDDTLGEQITIMLHVWSRYLGASETKAIFAEIYHRLHRGTFTVSGIRVVDMLFQGSEIIVDPDGVTRHGICQYTITAEQE